MLDTTLNRTQDIQTEREKREATEFIEILKTMSESERQQVKGVMIGIQLSKGLVRGVITNADIR